LTFSKFTAFVKDNSQSARRIKWLIGVLLFCLLMGIAIVIIPWQKTWQVLLQSNLLLIGLGLLLSFVSQFLNAYSYYVVAKKQNAGLGLWNIFFINIIMLFYDIVLPSTFFVSSLRWYRYNQYAKKPAETLTSLTYLKIFNILLTILLSAGLLFFYERATIEAYTVGIIALIIACFGLLYLTPVICKWLLKKVDKPSILDSSNSIKGFGFRALKKILAAFTEFENLDIKTQLFLIFLVVTSLLIQYEEYLLFAESVGIQLSFAQLGAVRATLLLVANIPVNFSVGIDLGDVTLVSMLVLLNVPLQQAVAMSIVALAKNYFYALLGALTEVYYLIRSRLKTAR
jgi:uncharacterized membrane protein YbhN (UPF0104 family)